MRAHQLEPLQCGSTILALENRKVKDFFKLFLAFFSGFCYTGRDKGSDLVKRMLALVLCLVLLWGCTPQEQVFQQYTFCMDTVMDLTVWGPDGEEALGEMISLLNELEDDWSATDENSLISALNRGENRADETQQALLDAVLALRDRTHGAFDPQLYGLITAWGFPTDEFRVPSDSELEAALEMELWDLGAAVKGYAGQRLAELLESYDVDRAILNLGGNVQTYGSKPDGSDWMVGIQDPEFAEDYLGLLAVTGTMSIVTSGDYQRHFELDGETYHHILDPETGYPADSGLSSVTVICADGLTADALSTALFVMGLEEAAEFWRGSHDFEAVFVTKDGKIYATSGANLSDCVYEVIER